MWHSDTLTRWQPPLSLMVTCCDAETARMRHGSIWEKYAILFNKSLSLENLKTLLYQYMLHNHLSFCFWIKPCILKPFQWTDVSEILVKWRWNDSLVINTKVSNLLIFTTEAFTTVNWSIDYQLLTINRTAALKSKFNSWCNVKFFDYFQILEGNIIAAVIDDRGI